VNGKTNNNRSAKADAPVPPEGTEQAADQAVKQQPPHAESGVADTIASVVDGVTSTVEIAVDILSIFE
jgi:hypothetical protein